MRTYVFVVGVDYEFRNTEFIKYCEGRIKYLLQRNHDQVPLVFFILDFKAGSKRRVDVTYKRGVASTSETLVASYTPVNSKRQYEETPPEWEFKRGQHGTLSILDVYKTMRDLGQDMPGTLAEVSFFSHAAYWGPVLVNSYDNVDDNARRDVNDMDPRAPKDFMENTTSPQNLQLMHNAFASDGKLWQWGCLATRVVRTFLLKVQRSSGYKSRGVKDSQQFPLTLSAKEVEWLGMRVVPKAGPINSKTGKATFTFGEIRNMVFEEAMGTYAYLAGAFLGVSVYAPLIGTGADPTRSKAGEALHVDAVKWRPYIAFMTTYLGFRLDPEGYNYGVYVPHMELPPSA